MSVAAFASRSRDRCRFTARPAAEKRRSRAAVDAGIPDKCIATTARCGNCQACSRHQAMALMPIVAFGGRAAKRSPFTFLQGWRSYPASPVHVELVELPHLPVYTHAKRMKASLPCALTNRQWQIERRACRLHPPSYRLSCHFSSSGPNSRRSLSPSARKTQRPACGGAACRGPLRRDSACRAQEPIQVGNGPGYLVRGG